MKYLNAWKLFCYIHSLRSWLNNFTLCVHVQFKVLILVLKAQPGLVPKYICNLVLHPSVTWLRPLQSSDRLDLFVPHLRTWHVQVPLCGIDFPAVCSTILSSSSSYPKSCLFTQGLLH